MANVTVEDPMEYREYPVDSNGKIHFGREHAKKKAKIIVETIEENGDE